MSFITKVWKNREVEFPGRKLITDASDPTDVKDAYVTRHEGTVTQAGDKINAANLNDLENRIYQAFSVVCESLHGTTDPGSADGKNGDVYYKTETDQVSGDVSVVAVFIKINGEWLEVSTGGSALPQAEGSEF